MTLSPSNQLLLILSYHTDIITAQLLEKHNMFGTQYVCTHPLESFGFAALLSKKRVFLYYTVNIFAISHITPLYSLYQPAAVVERSVYHPYRTFHTVTPNWVY